MMTDSVRKLKVITILLSLPNFPLAWNKSDDAVVFPSGSAVVPRYQARINVVNDVTKAS
jgi:hypothetical protein